MKISVELESSSRSQIIAELLEMAIQLMPNPDMARPVVMFTALEAMRDDTGRSPREIKFHCDVCTWPLYELAPDGTKRCPQCYIGEAMR